MADNGMGRRPVETGNGHSWDTGGAPSALPADEEYHKEAQRLIDEQTAALFAMVEQAAATAWGGQQVAMRRDDRSLIVGTGAAAVEFVIEAIIDLPADADPAVAFPTGQARCLVRQSGATIAEWVLRRVDDQGSEAITYAWVHGDTSAPVTLDNIAAILRG